MAWEPLFGNKMIDRTTGETVDMEDLGAIGGPREKAEIGAPVEEDPLTFAMRHKAISDTLGDRVSVEVGTPIMPPQYDVEIGMPVITGPLEGADSGQQPLVRPVPGAGGAPGAGIPYPMQGNGIPGPGVFPFGGLAKDYRAQVGSKLDPNNPPIGWDMNNLSEAERLQIQGAADPGVWAQWNSDPANAYRPPAPATTPSEPQYRPKSRNPALRDKILSDIGRRKK